MTNFYRNPMSLELSGSFYTDIFLMLGILFLPLPTTPYILYLFTTNSIFEAGMIFFLSTSLRDLISYYVGFFSNKLRSHPLTNFSRFVKENIQESYSQKISEIAKFSKKKLNQATVREIIVARWLGIHPIIIALGLGRLSSRINLFFIPNTFYVIIDIIFYWILLGSGKVIFEILFPGANIEDLFNNQYLYMASIFLIIAFYIVYAYVKWR